MNIESNIICSECSCIPLLGLSFDYERKALSDVCELYSYCIFNHNKEKKVLNKNIFDNIFLSNDKMNRECNLKMKCEFCKEKDIEYHCLDCQRNICKKCFENHKEHKYYYNRDYISENDLKQIVNKFEESQKNVKNNADLIYSVINL